MVGLPQRNRLCIARRWRAIGLTLFLGLIPSVAQNPKAPPKPTELVIKRYEKLIAGGSLLSPDGWKMASRLFEQSDPYPRNGEIQIVSVGGLVAENWMRGDEAEVETKWDDFYGTVDADLRFKPPPYNGSIMWGQRFTMIRTHQQPVSDDRGKTADMTRPEEWKIKGTQGLRFATIPAAIRYVEEAREQSRDPVIRENARKTIAALRRLSEGCGSASAC